MSNAVEALTDRLLGRLKDAQTEVGPELEARLRSLAEATTAYYFDGLGGTATEADANILKARAATLEAAGAQAVGRTVADALQDIAGVAIGLVFEVLI